MIRTTLTLSVFLLCSCVSQVPEINAPIQLIGTVSKPAFTGWYQDFCRNNELTEKLPDCFQVGGEIFEVKFSNIKTIEGEYIPGEIVIGFSAHGLARKYRNRVVVNLQFAEKDFQSKTGIIYIAKEWNDT